MDNYKFTKGKWILNDKKHYYEITTGEKNNIRVSTYPSDGEILHDGHEKLINKDFIQEKKANALLISKAPEMIQMLIRLRKEVDFGFSSWGNDKGLIISEEIEKLIKSATEL